MDLHSHFPQSLLAKQLGQHIREDPLGWNELTARKLTLETTLSGHDGCVNRLAWNTTEGGTLLASASDDTTIRLWPHPQHPHTHAPKCFVIHTQHEANILGLQFVPHCDSTMLVSGSMDSTVQLHQVSHLPKNFSSAYSSNHATVEGIHDAAAIQVEEILEARTAVYRCHEGRVKFIEVSPSEPRLFWSAAEDGTVRQFDTRLSVDLMNQPSSPNCLLTALSRRFPGRRLELKAISINHSKPHQVAVAGSEPAVRVYDRRMMSLTNGRNSYNIAKSSRSTHSTSNSDGLVLRLTPPHFALAPTGGGHAASPPSSASAATAGQMPVPGRQWWGPVYPTHVTFGNRGDALLATFHRADAFVFDVSGSGGGGGRSSSGSRRTSREETRLNAAAAAGSSSSSDGDDVSGVASPRSNTAKRASRSSQEASRSCGASKIDFSKPPPQLTVDKLSSTSVLGPGVLPLAADHALTAGNLAVAQRKYLEAVEEYTKGLRCAPSSAALLTARAFALLRRRWVGDAADALADAEAAVFVSNGSDSRAWLARIQALRSCGMPRSAKEMAAMRLAAMQLRALQKAAAADDDAATLSGADLNNTATATTTNIDTTPKGEDVSYVSEDERKVFDEIQALDIALRANVRIAERCVAVQQERIASLQAASRRRGLGSDPRTEESYRTSSDDDEGNSSSDSDGIDAGGVDGSGGGAGGGNQSDGIDKVDKAFAEALHHASDGLFDKQADDTHRADGSLPSTSTAAQAHALKHPDGNSKLQKMPWMWGAMPGSRRLLSRFTGHLNEHTDIKEAVFLGDNDSLVACGSDDGSVYIYDADTGARLVKILTGADSDIVNCIRPHPCLPGVLATSGIDNTVKIWTPTADDVDQGENIEQTVQACQDALRGDRRQLPLPSGLVGGARLFAELLRNPEMLRERLMVAARNLDRENAAEGGEGGGGGGGGEDDEGDGPMEIECRQS